MFDNFNWETPFNIPLTDWFICAAIIIGSAVLSKILTWFFAKVVLKLTAKTKTHLDDLLVEKVQKPVVYGITLIGFWFAIDMLGLPADAQTFFEKVFYLLVIADIAWALSKVVDALIEEFIVPIVEKSDSDLDDQILPILRKSIRAAIWAMAIIIGLNNAGYDVGALIAGLGIGGLALALAAQDSVKNLFGGFTIFTDKPFKIKDRVQINGFDGTIEEIGIRSTRLRTLDGRVVTIPNSKFADSPVENVSTEPNRKVVLNLGLTYAMTHEQVKLGMKIVDEIATSVAEIEDGHAIGFNAFNDSSLNIIFVYRIKSGEDILGTMTNINLQLLESFNKNGLDFAFPTQTIFHQQMN